MKNKASFTVDISIKDCLKFASISGDKNNVHINKKYASKTKYKKPIITTSINRHETDPINDVTQVEIDFPNIDIFEDSKHTPSKGSTIIDFSTSPYKIIRQGDGPFPQ